MSLHLYHTDCRSQCQMEDYFPLIVLFDTNYDIPQHMGFYYEDTDLLEVVLDNKDNMVRKIMLVICQHFTVRNENINTSNFHCIKGTLAMKIPDRTECDSFSVTLFNNGVKISVSANHAQTHFQMGQVIFGFDKEENLVELVCLLSEKELFHCKTELERMHIL